MVNSFFELENEDEKFKENLIKRFIALPEGPGKDFILLMGMQISDGKWSIDDAEVQGELFLAMTNEEQAVYVGKIAMQRSGRLPETGVSHA